MTRLTSGVVAGFAAPITVALVGLCVILSRALGTHTPAIDGPAAATEVCHDRVLVMLHDPTRPMFGKDKMDGGHDSYDDYGSVSYRTARGDGETSYFTCTATYAVDSWSTITVVNETVVSPARTSPTTTS